MNVTPESSSKSNPSLLNGLSAAQAVSATAEFSQLSVDRCGALYAVCYQPESGRNQLIRLVDGRSEPLLNPPFSVHSRVYEYGGRSWCLAESYPEEPSLFFVNGSDQQLYRRPLNRNDPQPLTQRAESRFLDPLWSKPWQCLIAIEELHGGEEVINRLVAINPSTGELAVLHQQYDFYSDLTLSEDGKQLSCIAWNHPYQPWLSSDLCLFRLEDRSQTLLGGAIALGQGSRSFAQPCFNSKGDLFAACDQQNWWNIWQFSEQGEGVERLIWEKAAECCTAQSQSGLRHFLPLKDGGWIASWINAGEALLEHRACDGKIQPLAQSFSHFRALCGDQRFVYLVAASQTQGSSLLQIDLVDRSSNLVLGADPLATEYPIGVSSHHTYSVAETVSNLLFYPPVNRCHEKPPLIITLHGGPVSCSYRVLNARIQYWLEQGFAVADIHYRGSTGYGRDYRMALAGQWGVSDVEDIHAAVDYLDQEGLIDPQAVCIRGQSAGGFSALLALVGNQRFVAAASLYGVTDPLQLLKHTHKFESHYLQWLIGDPIRDLDAYQQRAPASQVEQISTPVIFFQGERDAVVVPQQTQTMVDRLKQQQVTVDLCSFPDEAHGFRQASNQQKTLLAELAFYRRFLP